MTNITNSKYQLRTEELTRLDNVKLMSRAYYQYAAKSNGPSGIEFEDEKGRNYVITSSRFKAIDGQDLYDTLKYSNLEFSVLTDKAGAKIFNSTSKDNIEVYDIIVGDKSFITSTDVNEAEKTRRSSLLIFSLVVYCGCLIFYFKKRMDN